MWCKEGSPIQSHLDEFICLLQFLFVSIEIDNKWSKNIKIRYKNKNNFFFSKTLLKCNAKYP